MAQAALANEYITRDNLAYNGVAAVPQWEEPKVQTPEVEQPQRKEKVRPQKKRQTQTQYSVSVVGIVGFLLAAVLMIAVLAANVRYTEVSSEVVELQEQLEDLTAEEKKLKIRYEQAFDINQIEAYAVGTLHMSRPGDDQVVYTDASSADRGEILSTGKDDESALSRTLDFVESLIDYFK